MEKIWVYGLGELKLLFPKNPEVAVWTLRHLYVAGVAILGLPNTQIAQISQALVN